MFLPEIGVVAKLRVAHAAPDQGASQTHWEVIAPHTPFKEQSKSVEHGVVDWPKPEQQSASSADAVSVRKNIMRTNDSLRYYVLLVITGQNDDSDSEGRY